MSRRRLQPTEASACDKREALADDESVRLCSVRRQEHLGHLSFSPKPSPSPYSTSFPKQLAIMFVLPQQSHYDAAYRRGYAYGQAMCDPARRITIFVITSAPARAALGQSPPMSFVTKQDATVDSVVSAIQGRLPSDMPYPFTILSRGAQFRVLAAGDQTEISSLLPKFDATILRLHLEVKLPEPRDERSLQANETRKGRGGLRTKLRKLCGLHGRQFGRDDHDETNETSGVEVEGPMPSSEADDEPLAPPSYDKAMFGDR